MFSGSFTREAIATRRTESRMWETAIVVFRAIRGSFWAVREGLTLCHVHAHVHGLGRQAYLQSGGSLPSRLHTTWQRAMQAAMRRLAAAGTADGRARGGGGGGIGIGIGCGSAHAGTGIGCMLHASCCAA